MKGALRILTVSYMTFLVVLTLSGFFEGFFADLFYYAAFILPLLVARLLLGKDMNVKTAFSLPKKESVPMIVLSLFPFLGLTMAVSFLTSLLLSHLGFSSPMTDVSGNIFSVLIKHALLPACLEEMLFRLLPIALLLPYSKRGAVIFSSLFFAFMHFNLFQIPYAFVAGAVLAVLYISSGSIIPSFILHLVNNIFSNCFNGGLGSVFNIHFL